MTHPPGCTVSHLTNTVHHSGALQPLRLKLMHSGGCFIYISYHYDTALCIQMSLNVFHSPLQRRSLHRSVLQIQLIFPPCLRDLINMHDLRCQLSTLEWFFRKRYPSPAPDLYLNNVVYGSLASACVWYQQDICSGADGGICPRGTGLGGKVHVMAVKSGPL